MRNLAHVRRHARSTLLSLTCLERRDTPSTIVWANRGTPTADTVGYIAAFGAQAPAARAVTDAAILAWQNVIVSFNYADPAL